MKNTLFPSLLSPQYHSLRDSIKIIDEAAYIEAVDKKLGLIKNNRDKSPMYHATKEEME
jgi:hypothetical protein